MTGTRNDQEASPAPTRWRAPRLSPLLVLLVACQPCDPPPSPPPPFLIEIDYVSDTTPNIGDTYFVNWHYSEPDRVADQFVEVQQLTFDGHVSKFFFGCPPPEFLPSGTPPYGDCAVEEQTCQVSPTGIVFTNQCREFRGTFNGPLIVSITAQDSNNNTWHRESVTLTAEDSYFRVAAIERSNEPYPQINGSVQQLEFTNYYAIYNDSGSSLRMHDLSAAPENTVFSAEQIFLGSSSSVNESENFGFRLGSQFPILTGEFVGTPAGGSYGGVTSAAAVLVAARLALEGTYDSRQVKSQRGLEEIVTVTQSLAQPDPYDTKFPSQVLIVQIDLAAPNNFLPLATTLQMTPSNVRFGDRFQGLMMATFGSALGLVAEIGTSNITFSSQPNEATAGVTVGTVAAAGVTYQVTTANGTVLGPVSAILRGISWNQVPAVADTHIELLAPLIDADN